MENVAADHLLVRDSCQRPMPIQANAASTIIYSSFRVVLVLGMQFFFDGADAGERGRPRGGGGEAAGEGREHGHAGQEKEKAQSIS